MEVEFALVHFWLVCTADMEVSHFPDENRKISASGIQDGAHGGALDGINHRHLQHVTAAKKDADRNKVYAPEENGFWNAVTKGVFV